MAPPAAPRSRRRGTEDRSVRAGIDGWLRAEVLLKGSGPGHVLGVPPVGVRARRRSPASIVCDRTKTVVRRHVALSKTVPLHSETVAFARTPRLRHRGAGHLPPRQRRGGTPGADRARPCAGRPLVRLDRGDGTGGPRVGPGPPPHGALHPRRGDRAPDRRDHAALGRSRPSSIWSPTGIRSTSARTARSLSRPTSTSSPAVNVFPRQLVEARA